MATKASLSSRRAIGTFWTVMYVFCICRFQCYFFVRNLLYDRCYGRSKPFSVGIRFCDIHRQVITLQLISFRPCSSECVSHISAHSALSCLPLSPRATLLKCRIARATFVLRGLFQRTRCFSTNLRHSLSLYFPKQSLRSNGILPAFLEAALVFVN